MPKPEVDRSHEDGNELPRRSLLLATAVLLSLGCLLALFGRPFGLKTVAMIGFPLAILTGTALLLILLVLAGPGPDREELTIEERLAGAFVPAIAVDPSTGQVVGANDAAVELLGEDRVAVGVDITDAFEDDASRTCLRVIHQAMSEGRARVKECDVRTGLGRPRTLSLCARRWRRGRSPRVIVGFVERQVNDAVSDFGMVQERLMSNISHELRTPLNVVMGFSELIEAGSLGTLTDAQHEAASECHKGGEAMLNLIDDILDIGRSRSYYLPSETRIFDPGRMVQRIAQLLVGQARREDVRLVVEVADDLREIEVAVRPFKQLIYHMTLQGLDRSQAGDELTMRAECNEQLRLVVTDSGPEIDPDELQPREPPDIPEDEVSAALAPALLGLPLCATLAERFEGTLTAETDQDGTHLVFSMPIG